MIMKISVRNARSRTMENRTMRVAGFLKVFCCGSAVLLGVTEARADSGAWNNIASGDWNTPANWMGGVVPSGAGSVASFTNFVAATVNQNVPGLTLGGLFFANGFHTVTNNAISLDNNASPATVTVGIGAANTTRAVLAVPLNVTGGLTKRGAGQLGLTAETPGTLTGPVTLDGGTLSSSATGGAPLGPGSVAVNGGRLNLAPAGSGQDVALTAASGSTDATFTYSGAATLDLAKGANTSLTLQQPPAVRTPPSPTAAPQPLISRRARTRASR
jgi:autotransporter-associated beta strand protein